jgi:hypothetical protein
LIAKRRQERIEQTQTKPKTYQGSRHINAHHVVDSINLDDVVDYTVNQHHIDSTNDDIDYNTSMNNDTLLAHMAGRTSSSGDIRNVLAAKQKPEKGKHRKVNATESVPETLTVPDHTFKIKMKRFLLIEYNIRPMLLRSTIVSVNTMYHRCSMHLSIEVQMVVYAVKTCGS